MNTIHEIEAISKLTLIRDILKGRIFQEHLVVSLPSLDAFLHEVELRLWGIGAKLQEKDFEKELQGEKQDRKNV